MDIFLIVLAVLAVLFIMLLSLSVHVAIVYDNGWKTTIHILFFEFDVELSKILNFVLFPDKAGKKKAEKIKEEKKKEPKKTKKEQVTDEIVIEKSVESAADKPVSDQTEVVEKPAEQEPQNESKGNFITKMIDEDGIVGILLLASNLIETLNSAIITLFKGLHIYSLYVKMIIGGGDACDIGNKYGKICGFYYPIKGMILNGMKVDQYDDLVQPDFIAPQSEYEFQLIASMNVALVLKIGLKAGKVFLVNLIKNK